MPAEALLGDICNNAMSAYEPVRRELQQSGQLLLRVAANGCVFRAVAGGTGEAGAGSPSVTFSSVDRVRSLRKSWRLLPSTRRPREGPKGLPSLRQMASALHPPVIQIDPVPRPLWGRAAQRGAGPGPSLGDPGVGKQPVSQGLGSTEPARCILETSSGLVWKDELQRVPHPEREARPQPLDLLVCNLRPIRQPLRGTVCLSVQRALEFNPLHLFPGFPQQSTHRVA